MNLLVCEGGVAGNIALPAFQVTQADHVGLALPADYGAAWLELMKSLEGGKPTDNIMVKAKGQIVIPAGFDPRDEDWKNDTLLKYAADTGIQHDVVAPLLCDLGLNGCEKLGDLQPTSRTMLDLALAWARRPDFVILSTAGLDPRGIGKVADKVVAMIAKCSAIHLFHDSLIEDYRELNVFTKLVRCRRPG